MSISQGVKISIIIPTYNGLNLLEASLKSAVSQSHRNKEIIVVDNGSTDGTGSWVVEHYPQVKYVKLNYNAGFSIAVNEGIKHAVGEYVALLNNDAVACPTWLEYAIQAFKINNNVACVTPKILSSVHREKIDSSGDVMNIVGQAHSRGEGEISTEKYNVSKYVFSGSGCASIYNKDILKNLGCFEEIFFAYFEDLDLAWRLQKQGYLTWYCSEATVIHYRKATSKKIRTIDFFLIRNPWLCYFINTPIMLFTTRMSLFKFFLTFIHTSYWLLLKKRSTSGIIAAIWVIYNIPTILSLRQKRSICFVTNQYLDAWRINKEIKLLIFTI